MQYNTTYEEQTIAIGKQLAAMLSGGDIILLSGDLGAGKTTFTKGLAEELGVSDTITSPTFSIMNVYEAHTNAAITQVVHIDAYRLEAEDDMIAIGVEDYLGAKKTICIIEWPERIPKILEAYTPIQVSITHGSGDERTILIEGIS